MALSTADEVSVRLTLSWLRLRGSVVFVTTPTVDAALAAITATQELMVADLLPRLASAQCAAEDPDTNGAITRMKDVEISQGALSIREAQRETLAQQLADALGLVDHDAMGGPFVVAGECARETFMDCTCTCEETTT